MKTLKLKKIVAVAVAALGLVAFAASPSVTVNSVTEVNGTWSTINVKYTLTGVDQTADYKVRFDVTADGVTKTTTDSAAKKSNTSYTKTIDTKDLFGSARRDAKATVTVSLIRLTPDVPVPDAVQLWEDGPYFATFNIGASAPEEYGYYFWWGDTVGYKRNANDDGWVSVKDGSSFDFWSKNSKIVTNGKSIAGLYSAGYIDDANSSSGKLMPAYDAARAYLGAPWRMMTADELVKLVNTSYCTRTWVTSYKGKSVSGYVVKGAKDPYKNNEVFFPAAGYGIRSNHSYSGSRGDYWTSTPYSDPSYARLLSFVSGGFSTSTDVRYCGQPVRPVRGFAE